MSTDRFNTKRRTADEPPPHRQLLYSDLTYKIIGALYHVFNELGFGYREKHYQRALVKEFSKIGVGFKMEIPSRITYSGKRIGAYFYDFLIDDKIVLELKVGEEIYADNIKQLLSYLRDSKRRVGILTVFTSRGVKYRRLIN